MLIKMLKSTWLYKKFDGLRNTVFRIFERMENRQAQELAALSSIEHRQQQQDEVLASLSANDTSILEGLLHLVQRAPADNALAESRQAALLREIRERSDASADQLLALARRLGKLADREDHATLAARMDTFERGVSTRLEALNDAFAPRLKAIEEKIASAREGLATQSDLA
jgi:hypothetical protein